MALKEINDILDAFQKAFTVLAIIVGGGWAYFHFFKGRTYKMRLEPNVSGHVYDKGGGFYLMVTSELNNVGLSKVAIEQKGSAIRIFFHDRSSDIDEFETAYWTRLAAFPVFESHAWIESKEVIREEKLIAVPKGKKFAFRLELRIVSEGISWKAMKIIPIE